MKLGILLCDSVSPGYRPPHRDYPEKFRDLLPDYDHRCYACHQGEIPVHPSDQDAWLITGSRKSVYDHLAWIRQLMDFVRSAHDQRVPMIGVCFGHQLIGQALGGQVEKQGWNVGIHRYSLRHMMPWMDPQSTSIDILMMCQDQLTTLPPDATLLASTDLCPHAMYQVGDHILCLQGHPEFSIAFERQLLEDRYDLIGAEKVAAALHSLSQDHDGPLVAKWITRFLSDSKG